MKKNVKIAILTLTIFILLTGITAITAADTNNTNTQVNTQTPTITQVTTQTIEDNTTTNQQNIISKTKTANTNNVETTTQKTNTNNNVQTTTTKSITKNTTNTLQTSKTIKTNTTKINSQNNNNPIITPTTTVSQKTIKTIKKSSGQDYYVSDSKGLDTNDGLTTATAFKTIAKAINSTTNTQTYNIHILTGTYKGVGNTNLTVPGDYTIYFIGDGINKTVIDGEAKYTIGESTVWGGNNIWNPYNNITGNWCMNITKGTGLITIRNLNIQNMINEGPASLNGWTISNVDNYGNLIVNNVYFKDNMGGIGASIRNNANSTLQVNNSIFEGNRKSSNTGNYGAGIFNNGTAIIENSSFIHNYARWGTITNDHVLNITNCIIRDGISYDGASTYKNGAGILANTGSSDFYNIYSVNNIITNVQNCTFINNTQCSINQGGWGTLIVNNCLFNETTGIILNSGKESNSVSEIISNCTFTNITSSNIFGSLSIHTNSTFAIYSTTTNLTIENNILNTKEIKDYGLYLNGNTTVRNNTLNNLIYFYGTRNNIINNTINSSVVYTVIGTGKQSNIVNNTLYASIFTGNDTVAIPALNTVENNTPVTGTDIIINNTSYYNYFNNDGTIKADTITNGSKIYLENNLTNKQFNLDNVKVYITAYNTNTIVYNCSINTTKTAKIIVENLNFNNTNNYPYVIALNSDYNLITNNNIYVNTTSLIHTILINGNYNTLKDNAITTSGPSNNIKYDINYYGIADTISVLIQSSHNTLTNNQINTYYTNNGETYGTIEGISIQTPTTNTAITDNILTKNQITTYVETYGYGLNIFNSNKNNMQSGTIKTNSKYYGNGIQIIDSNDNTLTGTIYVNSTEYGYGLIIQGISETANNNIIYQLVMKNITANKAYGTQIVNTNNTQLLASEYFVDNYIYGNYTLGVGAYNTTNTLIKLYYFELNGNINTTDETDYNQIKPITAGIKLINSTQSTINGVTMYHQIINGINYNSIGSAIVLENSTNITIQSQTGEESETNIKPYNTTNTPIILKNSNNNTINSLEIYTNATSTVQLENSSNNTITNNNLISYKGYYGDNAVYQDANSKNNNITNNIPNYTNKINITVTPGITTTNTTFNIKITNNDTTSGIIYFYNNNTLIGISNVTNNTSTFNYIFKNAGMYNITLKYNNITTTVQFKINKTNTTTKVNPITAIATNNITLQANITDINGNKINEGTVTFRINGSTLKDAKGNMIYVNVTNGKALLNYTIPGSWAKNNLTIQAIYHGTNTYSPSQNISTVNVTKTTPNVKIINGNINTVYNSTTPISVQVTDNNGNIIQSGKIALKLNGKTIGHAYVINGIANYNYTTQNSARTYKLTVIYGSSNYNRAETNTNFTVKKQNTTITTNPITTTAGSKITITGLIKNNDQNPIDHNTKIAIKIDGKTIGHTTSNNGLINYNYTIPTNYKNPTHTITIISGANNFYNGNITSTTLTINNKKNIKT